MNRRPELVMFDCDGVLVDSERLEPLVVADALGWLQLDANPHEIHARAKGAELTRLFELLDELSDEPLPAGFATRYRARQLDGLAAVEAVPGALDAVAAVADAGLASCVASGGPIIKMEVTLGAVGLWDHFAPNIFSSYQIDRHKPDPGVYLHAMKTLNAKPEVCVAVEDSVNGVRAAAGSGAWVVGLARDAEPDDLVDAGANQIISHMNQLPAVIADLGVSSPQER